MILGAKLNLGGQDYIVPALSWGFIRHNGKLIDKLQKLGDNIQLTTEVVDDFTKVIIAAMKRNYPNITEEEVENVVDMNNLKDVFQAIMGQSGFVENGEMPAGETIPAK